MNIRKPIQKYKFPGMLAKSGKDVLPVFEKLAVRPTGGKNWCDLPYEMKKECMKWMDLPTKFRMRRTGRTEKDIFDQMKFSIDAFDIDVSDTIELKIVVSRRTWTLTSSDVVPADTVVKCAAFLLRSAENIGEVTYAKGLSSFENEVSLLNELQKCESFRFSNFCFIIDAIDVTIDVPVCMLKKCSVPPEGVTADCKESFNLGPLLAVPQFTTANNITYMNEIGEEEVLQYYSEIAQKWIENDAPIGNRAAAYGFRNRALIVRFAERFADRLVAQNRWGVRIRTDNPQKHIVLTFEWCCFLEIIDASEPLWSKEDESDYDSDSDAWSFDDDDDDDYDSDDHLPWHEIGMRYWF